MAFTFVHEIAPLMTYFDSSLGKIHFTSIGQQGKPLLLIHGNGFSSAVFKPHIKHFQEKFRLYLPDLPGHGESERIKKFPPDYYTQVADIFLDWLRKENLKEINIIGVRGGSIIAMNMAVKAPELVKKIIADSFPGKKISNGNLDLIIEETRKSTKRILPRLKYRQMHGKDWKDVIHRDIDLMESMKFNDNRVVVPEISEIKSEVLLIGVSRDTLVPNLDPVYKKLQKKYPHFNFALIEYGKHPSMLSNKSKFRKEVFSFLKN
jgi:pimeloyl-ACP methyl ester carboxylesterase